MMTATQTLQIQAALLCCCWLIATIVCSLARIALKQDGARSCSRSTAFVLKQAVASRHVEACARCHDGAR